MLCLLNLRDKIVAHYRGLKDDRLFEGLTFIRDGRLFDNHVSSEGAYSRGR